MYFSSNCWDILLKYDTNGDEDIEWNSESTPKSKKKKPIWHMWRKSGLAPAIANLSRGLSRLHTNAGGWNLNIPQCYWNTAMLSTLDGSPVVLEVTHLKYFGLHSSFVSSKCLYK